MNNKKTTRRALFSSFMALLLCCSMLVGTTFAWFTDSVTSTNNIIKSGTLDVKLYYGDSTDAMTELTNETKEAIFDYKFWEPGFTQTKYIKIENAGDLAFRYQLHMLLPKDAPEDANKLAEVIDVYCAIAGEGFDASERDVLGSMTKLGTLKELMGNANGVDDGILLPATGKGSANVANITGEIYTGDVTACIALQMQEEAGNDYQNLSVGEGFNIQIIAAQMTYEKDSFDELYDKEAAEPDKEYPTTVDKWDGTVDISWYNDTDTEFTLASAEQFAGFALLTGTTDRFAGKTINLGVDVDLDGKSFAPIGTTGERDSRNRLVTVPFEGTFDGNGKTIANLSQSGWDFGYEWGQYGSLGLFSQLENATVKNVVLEGFDCAVEGGDISFIAGSAEGDCTFENIEIKSGSIGTYNNGIGGIIGWSGEGTYNFKNITLGEDVVIGGLWGSFDSSVGGIVGQGEPGATYNFENVDIACRLDVYNDCTASYDYYNYRMCGMIIGRLEKTTTIDGTNYPDMTKYNITCKDVTVTYGDWANYHYCEPTPGLNGGRGMRVEPGYAYDGLPADFDHSQCTTNHMALIPFDQIFGGDQIGVKGLKTYDGVTVTYNNK